MVDPVNPGGDRASDRRSETGPGRKGIPRHAGGNLPAPNDARKSDEPLDSHTTSLVFTLFYGLIRTFVTNDERFRFGAVAVGPASLLALVYWKFSRFSTTNAA